MPVQQESKGAAALTAAEVESRYGIDLTTAEVLRHALRYTSLQMEQKVKAAGLSPLLAEIGDFGIGLLGPRDEARDARDDRHAGFVHRRRPGAGYDDRRRPDPRGHVPGLLVRFLPAGAVPGAPTS